MEKVAYHIVPRVLVRFTQEDLDVLWACSSTHYDSVVNSLSSPGGKLWGMRNMLGEEKNAEYELSQGDLDTLAKAMENRPPSVNADQHLALRDAIWNIWEGLRAQYRLLNAAK